MLAGAQRTDTTIAYDLPDPFLPSFFLSSGGVILKGSQRILGTALGVALGLTALYFTYLCNGLSYDNDPLTVWIEYWVIVLLGWECVELSEEVCLSFCITRSTTHAPLIPLPYPLPFSTSSSS